MTEELLPADAEQSLDADTDSSTTGTTPAKRTLAARIKRPWLIAAAAVVLVTAAVGGTVVGMTKSVTITVDGQQQTVSTLSGDVEGALDSADITVGEHDTLAPAADADDQRRHEHRREPRSSAHPDDRRREDRGLDHRHHRRGRAGPARS